MTNTTYAPTTDAPAHVADPDVTDLRAIVRASRVRWCEFTGQYVVGDKSPYFDTRSGAESYARMVRGSLLQDAIDAIEKELGL
jgi:hypothetical protein